LIDQAAENWKQKFLQTTEYRRYINDPLKQLGTQQPAKRKKKRRLGILGTVRQFFTLSRRYLEVLLKDKLNLLILFAQAPIIALLTFRWVQAERWFILYSHLFPGSHIGFGREIIRERPIINAANGHQNPSVSGSKLSSSMIVSLRAMLFVP
jgi:hypothetical protein